MNWLEALQALQRYTTVRATNGDLFRMVSHNGRDMIERKAVSRGFTNWCEYIGMLNEFIGERFTAV